MRARHGFTLTEMLVAVVLLGLVSTGIYKVMTANQRVAQEQTERASLQSNLRLGSQIALSELRELGSDDVGLSDLIVMQADRLEYRAMRGLGFACQVSANEIRVRKRDYYGPDPTPGRTRLFAFIERDPDLSTDDGWSGEMSAGGVNVNSTCPDGRPAYAIILANNAVWTAAIAAAQVEAGAPVRLYDRVELSTIQQDGRPWLGAKIVSAGGNVEPVIGPLQAGGVQFRYLDANGNVTAVPGAVESIELTLSGISDRRVPGRTGGDGHLQDALVTRVRLRNVQ